MAKFGKSVDDEPAPPVEREVPPKPAVVVPPPEPMYQSPPPPPPAPTPVQTVSEPVAMPVMEVEDPAPKKEEEHWMKAMWRPAMGWLYMVICFMDFVAFPAISMFMPILVKGMTYMAWQSLTLSNGGLIHMAFGAILGVAAYGRTQEKVASKQ
jgi:hypothetical protein